MQLILTHADLETALINDLRNKGMTAFEPGKASVDFSFKRGTKELICTLDTDPKPEAPVAPKSKSDATETVTTSAPLAEVPDTAPAGAVSEAAQVAEAAAEVPVTTTTEALAEVPAAAGEDDNLFD
jgi:septal ring-binding cell division protein DamX